MPFDLESLTVQGTPVAVLDKIDTVDVNGCAQFTLSADGDLAYLTAGEDQAELELIWTNISGQTSTLDIGQPYSFQHAFRPDSQQLAMMIPAANDKIFIYDFQRKIMTRLTNTPGNDGQPIWSPDGSQIVYRNDRDGSRDLYVIHADGGTPARRLVASPEDEFPNAWTPDGARILYSRVNTDGKREICSVASDGSEDPVVMYPSEYSNWMPALSHDGRWLAYTSNASGRPDVSVRRFDGRRLAYTKNASGRPNVYVRRFDGTGRPVRVSAAGGQRPQWSPDDKTLYYDAGDEMMATPIETAGVLQVGTATKVFELDPSSLGTMPLAPDGEHFIIIDGDPQLRKHFRIRVVFDWAEKLGRTGP